MNIVATEEKSSHSTDSKESVHDEADLGEEHMIRCRLSTTCKDYKIDVRTRETVSSVKKRLARELELGTAKQRWFFGGKMLYDKMTIGDIRIPRGYVIQVILAPVDA